MKRMLQYEDYDAFADDYCDEVVERIKQLLEKSGISQGTLAAKSGLGQSTVSKFLAGDTRVSLIHIAKICRALEDAHASAVGEQTLLCGGNDSGYGKEGYKRQSELQKIQGEGYGVPVDVRLLLRADRDGDRGDLLSGI